MGRGNGDGGSASEALVQEEGLYNYRDRPVRDVGWLAAYLAFLLATLAGGIYAFFHRNQNFTSLIRPEYLNNPANCPLPTDGADALLGWVAGKADVFQLDLFLKAASLWIVTSVLGSLALGLAFLCLVRLHPGALVIVALVLQVLAPLSMSGVAFAYQATPAGIALLSAAGFTVLLFALWHEQVRLVIRLMGVAGAGLAANPGIAGVTLLLQGVLGIACIPLLLAMLAAFMNGNVGPNPRRTSVGGEAGSQICSDSNGNTVLCCTWQPEIWAYSLMSCSSTALFWTTALIFEIKVFTISGAIAQWYFSPASSAASRGSPTLRSLRLAVSSSLGSLCLGSAILTTVQLLRQAMEKLRQEADNNLLVQCLVACLGFLYSLLEFLTKFATVRLAITGEPFFTAAHNVVNLLRRNVMDAYGVWFLPGLVLQTCAIILAAAWGTGVSLLGYALWHKEGPHHLPQPRTSAILLGVIAFVASWVVLSFCVSILLNIIDATYVCFAMDRDRKDVTRQDVHDVFSKVPAVGEVVEHPDGHMTYGAPQPPAYPPAPAPGHAAPSHALGDLESGSFTTN